MFQVIRHMLRKELIQVLRDPRMARIVFLAPMIQLVIFGYAATTDVRHVRTAVYDLDGSVASRDLTARFVRSGYFDVVSRISAEDEVRDLMDRGEALCILRMNKGFGESIQGGRTAMLQIILDGTDANTAGIVLGYSAGIVRGYSEQVLVSRAERLAGRSAGAGQVQLRSRAWFNENLESRNFYVPGVIVNITLIVTLILTSMAVVREKEIGTMEQIMVTPIRPIEFIIGKTVPFALIALADVLIILVGGVFIFDVPVRGSLLLLFACTLLFLMTTLGVGLLISTVCGTQQQAMMSAFFFIFPAMLLSGFIFPIANMPRVVQWITYLNPMRYFLVIVRGIFLKGVGIGVLWPQMAALAAIGLCTLWLASARFKKTLA